MPEAAQVGSFVTTPASHVWSYTALICAMRAVSQSFMEKTKAKIAELQKQLRELEAAKTGQENLQIIQLVRGLNMKPEEFAAFLRGGALQTAPAPQPDFEQEGNADEE